MIVRIKKDDERLGVKAGEVYEAGRYWLDPHDKVSLLKRIPDGYDPECNQYRDEVEILLPGRRLHGRISHWWAKKGGTWTPLCWNKDLPAPEMSSQGWKRGRKLCATCEKILKGASNGVI